jgi:hypothetical protein
VLVEKRSIRGSVAARRDARAEDQQERCRSHESRPYPHWRMNTAAGAFIPRPMGINKGSEVFQTPQLET